MGVFGIVDANGNVILVASYIDDGQDVALLMLNGESFKVSYSDIKFNALNRRK